MMTSDTIDRIANDLPDGWSPHQIAIQRHDMTISFRSVDSTRDTDGPDSRRRYYTAVDAVVQFRRPSAPTRFNVVEWVNGGAWNDNRRVTAYTPYTGDHGSQDAARFVEGTVSDLDGAPIVTPTDAQAMAAVVGAIVEVFRG